MSSEYFPKFCVIFLITINPILAGFTLTIKPQYYDNNLNRRLLESYINSTTKPDQQSQQDLYTVQAEIGTPPITFNKLVVDTGSPWFWLPSNKLAGYSGSTFSCLSSTTCTSTKKNQVFQDYQGEITEGMVTSDIVKISDSSLNLKMDFILASELNGTYLSPFLWSNYQNTSNVSNIAQIDGIIGLGPNPNEQQNGYANFLTSLYADGIISSKWFSIYQSSKQTTNENYIQIGFETYDPSFLKSATFQQIPTSQPSQWSFGLNPTYWYLGDQNISPSLSTLQPEALLSSALSYILLPPQDFTNFFAALQNAIDYQCSLRNGLISCHCSPNNLTIFPSINFASSNGVNFTITADTYIEYDASSNSCIALIGSTDNEYFQVQSDYEDMWLLGAPFFETYMIIFNSSTEYNNLAVGSLKISEIPIIPDKPLGFTYISIGTFIMCLLITGWIIFRTVPESLKDLSRTQKYLKLTLDAADFGIHVIAFILMCYETWYLIYKTTFTQYSFEIDAVPNYVLMNSNIQSPDFGINSDEVAQINGQQCAVYTNNNPVLNNTNELYIVRFCMLLGLILYIISHVFKYYINIFKNMDILAFSIQNFSFCSILLTAYSTFSVYENCYSFNSIYMDDNGGLEDYFKISLWLSFFTAIITILSLFLVIGIVTQSRKGNAWCARNHLDEEKNKKIFQTLGGFWLVLILATGIFFRVVTYLQGFDKLLISLYLIGDLIFFFNFLISTKLHCGDSNGNNFQKLTDAEL